MESWKYVQILLSSDSIRMLLIYEDPSLKEGFQHSMTSWNELNWYEDEPIESEKADLLVPSSLLGLGIGSQHGFPSFLRLV